MLKVVLKCIRSDLSIEDDQRWVMSGHDIIFDKIMMMVGFSSLESLHRCRQVCRAWNAMIMTNIWESPSKRNILLIEKNWGHHTLPSKDAINHAKWLGKNQKAGCVSVSV